MTDGSIGGEGRAVDVSKEEAVAACERARAANAHRLLSAARMQYWGCMKYGGRAREAVHALGDRVGRMSQVDRELPSRT